MGDPRRLKKKYETPSHPWQKQRIEEEGKIQNEFGLKNKQEIWKAKTMLKKYRHLARDLVALAGEERVTKEKALIDKMMKMGFVPAGTVSVDAVLSLKVEDVLNRRLQTRVWKANLGKTSTQARQLITHGHISMDGRKVTTPGMMVTIDSEKTITWYGAPVVTPEAQNKPATAIKDLAATVKPDEAEVKGAVETVERTIEGEGQ